MNTNNSPTSTKAEATSDMKRREVGALWKKEGKATGQKFLTGHIKVDEFGTEKLVKIIVFSNKNKTNPKAPDFVIYTSRENEQGGAPAPVAQTDRKPFVKREPVEENNEDSVL